MIVHICCSVDSWYFLDRIRSDYPDEHIIGYFYNPNIHPKTEYETRKIDAKRSCDMQNIEFIEGEYELQAWFKATKGLEDEPEKGARCAVCFDKRLYKTAELADRLNHKSYTTTLLMSPKKDFSQLATSASKLKAHFDSQFLIVDYRKGGGTQAQFKLAKAKQAYHQNYCGCMFALNKQRKAQGRIANELVADLMPSTNERLDLYTKRIELEEANIKYKIIKERFIDSKILEAGIFDNSSNAIRSDVLPYSFGDFKFKATPSDLMDGVQYIEKNGVFVVTKDFASDLSPSDLRLKLNLNHYSIAPVFVVDSKLEGEVTVLLRSVQWQDIREVLVPIK